MQSYLYTSNNYPATDHYYRNLRIGCQLDSYIFKEGLMVYLLLLCQFALKKLSRTFYSKLYLNILYPFT